MADDSPCHSSPSTSSSGQQQEKTFDRLLITVKRIIPDDHPDRVSLCNNIDTTLALLGEVVDDVTTDSNVISIFEAFIHNSGRRKVRSHQQVTSIMNDFIYGLSVELNVKKTKKKKREALEKATAKREETGVIDPILSRRKHEEEKNQMIALKNNVHTLLSKLRKLQKKELPDDDEEAEKFWERLHRVESDLMKAHAKYNAMLGNTLSTTRMSNPFHLKTSTAYPCIDQDICKFITDYVNSNDRAGVKYSRPDFDTLEAQIESIGVKNKLSLGQQQILEITKLINKEMITEYHNREDANLNEDLDSYISDQSEEDAPDEEDPLLIEALENNAKNAKTERQVLDEFAQKEKSLTEEERQALEASELSSIDNTASEDEYEDERGDSCDHENALLTDSGDDGDESSNDEEEMVVEELANGELEGEEGHTSDGVECGVIVASSPPKDSKVKRSRLFSSPGQSQQQNKRSGDMGSNGPPIKVAKISSDAESNSSSPNSSSPPTNTTNNSSAEISRCVDIVDVIPSVSGVSGPKKDPIDIIELSSDSEDA